jgi:hypothetical protein
MRKGYKRYAAITTVMAGLIALFAPTADAAPTGCGKVAPADRAVCRGVLKQHAYGWTDEQGTPQTWRPNGRKVVAEITGDSELTQEEMGLYLRGEADAYREYVTHVTFNMDEITRRCGHLRGSGSVAYVTEHGKSYTFRIVVCD